MKFFIDTANLDEIREAYELGVLDGVTTNPSLMAKEGVTGKDNIFKHYRAICEIVDDNVSAEVVATTFDEIIAEGEELAEIHEKIVVKVPMIRDGVKAIKYLSQKGIRTNCTLVFSAGQAILAAKAGASYVSPFMGRLDDIGSDGLDLIEQIMQIYRNYGFATEVLAASVRHVMHLIRCAEIGADVVTCPLNVITGLLKHPLTDSGLEKFLSDYRKGNPEYKEALKA
ncbi:transaldolase [Catalinimonas alkaloidigena]|uniref:Probable transaldolase n=1 Tax=Catalinimonas alkaloidigena TaxID=1075417 RepID=A0A1G8WS99_9BACT|nr:fructose-6-phosphate aldolase [Catalinimonas alkaloidigena]SDJ80470.1 transaldolase [Catalinimonas alkaloidigena]